jgi:hypothetical protein
MMLEKRMVALATPARHGRQQHDGVAAADWRLEALQVAHVLIVDEHVDEATQAALWGHDLFPHGRVAREQVMQHAF